MQRDRLEQARAEDEVPQRLGAPALPHYAALGSAVETGGHCGASVCPMEHQALPTLQEVAATLQKLGVEHERQLSELRHQVELLQTQVRSEAPLPTKAPSAPAPAGSPQSLPLDAHRAEDVAARSEASLHALHTYPELPGMLSEATMKHSSEDGLSSSSSSSLASNPSPPGAQ
eukprot:Skav219236  [mRNA]  locus=scaffold1242:18653:28562:- [translate_table: standard]